jgi:hypothetical protein
MVASMSQRILSFIPVLIAFSALVGCSTLDSGEKAKQSCLERDWYEVGRRDGSQGLVPDRMYRFAKECKGEDKHSDWQTIYTNGRNAGLVEYCDPKNAYDLGRSGTKYESVCPSTVEAAFLKNYDKGMTVRKLEIENQKLTSQLEALNQRLAGAKNTFEQKQLSQEIKSLKAQQSKNDRDLRRSISSIK